MHLMKTPVDLAKTNNIEMFRAAFNYLVKKHKAKRNRIAAVIGAKPPIVSDFLNGKPNRSLSEEKREMVAAYFGKSYVEMLLLGDILLKEEPSSNADSHDSLIQTLSEEIVYLAERLKETRQEIAEQKNKTRGNIQPPVLIRGGKAS